MDLLKRGSGFTNKDAGEAKKGTKKPGSSLRQPGAFVRSMADMGMILLVGAIMKAVPMADGTFVVMAGLSRVQSL